MQIIQTVFILFLSFFFSLKLAKYFRVNQLKITFVFILKTIICLYYIPIAESLDNDAYGYFYNSLNVDNFRFIGADFIFNIVKFLRVYLNLDIVSISLIFSFFGIIGSIVLASNIENLTSKTNRKIRFLTGLVIFFPTLNIWTSAIGKDPITFTCANLILYSLLNIRFRILLLIIASILIALIRPFLGIILFVCLAISLNIKLDISGYKKLIIRLSALIGIIFANTFQNKGWLKFENLSYELFLQAISYYSEVTQTGNNAIQLENLPIPMKIFSFMFRPIFFDANNFFTLLMSFENFIYILIFVYPFYVLIKYSKIKKITLNLITLFSLLFLTFTWIPYSLTVANLGTANRYKITIIPILITLSLIFSEKSNSRNSLINS